MEGRRGETPPYFGGWPKAKQALGHERTLSRAPWVAELAFGALQRWVGAERGKARSLAQGGTCTGVLRPRNKGCLLPFSWSSSPLLTTPPGLPGNPCCPRPVVSPTSAPHHHPLKLGQIAPGGRRSEGTPARDMKAAASALPPAHPPEGAGFLPGACQLRRRRARTPPLSRTWGSRPAD